MIPDSLDAIQRQYLQGDVLAQQGEALKADAFHRLLNWRAPLIPVALAVQVQRVEEIGTRDEP